MKFKGMAAPRCKRGNDCIRNLCILGAFHIHCSTSMAIRAEASIRLSFDGNLFLFGCPLTLVSELRELGKRAGQGYIFAIL